MAIPDFQSLFLPLLELTGDQKVHRMSEAIDSLAGKFQLAEDEKKELLPSGRQAKFTNRVAWARAYLKAACLLENVGRGEFRITDRGLEVLKTKPASLDIRSLKQFQEFRDFQSKAPVTPPPPEGNVIQPDPTPEELLESGYQAVRQVLRVDLLQRVRNVPPEFFEKLVVDLLVAMGYGGSRKDAGQAVGKAGDGGIDGIIKEDKLGLDVVYVQAKRWKDTVGRPAVQAFAGSLEGHRARKGVFITTSEFSKDAHDYVNRIEKKIVLIDGEQLAQFMIDHGIGVTEVASYNVKKVDADYFGYEE